MKKAYILELVRELPEELDEPSLQQFLYAVWVRAKIEYALRVADEEEGMPHEDFMREVDQWLA